MNLIDASCRIPNVCSAIGALKLPNTSLLHNEKSLKSFLSSFNIFETLLSGEVREFVRNGLSWMYGSWSDDQIYGSWMNYLLPPKHEQITTFT